MNRPHDFAAILKEILKGYCLPVSGDHGVVHWSRVFENGIRLSKVTGADVEVVSLFALFHDSRRVNEFQDEGHGGRGADLAKSFRGNLVHLDDSRFDLLYEACRLHTNGLTAGDPTLLTCWDADRLDLGRVGITPLPDRLATDAGRELLEWAHRRAIADFIPMETLSAWNIFLDQLAE
ncbi:MAG: hypothetical protein ABL888_01855 [Pirellulaceae bacterium]